MFFDEIMKKDLFDGIKKSNRDVIVLVGKMKITGWVPTQTRIKGSIRKTLLKDFP